jgi:peptidoglycan hydrolase-like protein with peptidoglycan-binding domain
LRPRRYPRHDEKDQRRTEWSGGSEQLHPQGQGGDCPHRGHPTEFALAIDQDFGAATELAVMRFQGDKKLTVDGIVGKEPWDAIGKAAESTSLSSRPSELLVLDALR